MDGIRMKQSEIVKAVADKLKRKPEFDFEIDYTTKAIKYTGARTTGVSMLELYRYMQKEFKNE